MFPLQRSTDKEMKTFIFIGTVLPDTARVSSPDLDVRLDRGMDYPSGTIRVRINDNRVIGIFRTEQALTDVGFATIRNIVKDIASSICNAAAIVQGAWTVVTVDTSIDVDGNTQRRFSNASDRLRAAFQRYGITADDITLINQHADGYFLRLALDDLKAALMDQKFMRSHMYRAVESLRNSVAPSSIYGERANCWKAFWKTLDVDRSKVKNFSYQEERHADYASARPLSSEEVDANLDAIVCILFRYIGWFKSTKLTTSYAGSSG